MNKKIDDAKTTLLILALGIYFMISLLPIGCAVSQHNSVVKDTVVNNVTVDSNVIVYGLNGNIAFSPLDYSSEVLCNKIVELGVTEIRWPGGTISSKYHWTKYDIDNLKNVSDRGIKIIFVLNMITSNINEQLAMLKYAASLGIKFSVEFGNELTNGQNDGRIFFHKSGLLYGNMCKLWSDSIKKYFPTVPFACWLENKPDIKTWVSETLSRYTPDGCVNHFYPNAKDVARNGVIDTALLHAWVITALYHAGVSGLSIPIYATEFNMSDQDLSALKPGEHERALAYMLKLFTQLKFSHIIVHNIDGNNGVFAMTKTSVEFTGIGNIYKTFLHFN